VRACVRACVCMGGCVGLRGCGIVVSDVMFSCSFNPERTDSGRYRYVFWRRFLHPFRQGGHPLCSVFSVGAHVHANIIQVRVLVFSVDHRAGSVCERRVHIPSLKSLARQDPAGSLATAITRQRPMNGKGGQKHTITGARVV